MQLHDVFDSEAGVFNAMSGTLIDLKHPSKSMIRIDDIAHALSHICRFGGHSTRFYSVAQHSVLVAALAPDNLKKAALLHDAAEAYLGDVIKPLKIRLGQPYSDLEMKFTAAICSKFEIDPIDMICGIKPYDKEALNLEHEFLIAGNCNGLYDRMLDRGLMVIPMAWEAEDARYEFIRVYSKLFDIDLDLLRWH